MVALILGASSIVQGDESQTGPDYSAVEQTGPSYSPGAKQDGKSSRQRERGEKLPKRRIAPPRQDADAAAVTEFVSKLLGEMTLDEKVGQMCLPAPSAPTSAEYREQIRAGGVGAIFFPNEDGAVRDLQQIAVEESRLGVPLVVGRDVIHGFRTVGPIPLGQAASWDPELVESAARVAGDEARRTGIHWTFAPMLDIARDPRWGRIAESLGEDPVLASSLGAAMVRGFQGGELGDLPARVAACPKHYVAYGLAEGGRDYNSVMVSRSELRNVYLRPFRAGIEAGAQTLMASFNTINGTPATAHRGLLHDVLKEEWGFDGYVVSDWGAIHELVAHGYAADDRDAAGEAAHAAMDMDMSSLCYQDHLADLVETGAVDEAALDDAVERILRVKFRLGLFHTPYADASKPELLCAEHRDVMRRLATESLVLLKNDGTLPIQRQRLRRVAVVGAFADAARDQLGTWTMDGRDEDVATPLPALKAALGAGVEVVHVSCRKSKYEANQDEISAAVAAARDADLVLAFVGEEEVLSGEAHSRSSIDLPGGQSELIAALEAANAPVVMIVFAGRPLSIGRECAAVDAVLYAWHPGTMGGPAIVDVLLGNEAPSGKLPVSFPRTVGQAPIYYNHLSTGRPPSVEFSSPGLPKAGNIPGDDKYKSHYLDVDPTPEFPFGFGLSYGKFEYDGFELSRPTIAPGQTLAVRARVKNTGERTATETVQLYVRDVTARTVRPVRELKAFRRVALKPGAAEVVEFALPASDLAYYDEQERQVLEPGKFRVWVGGDSTTTLGGEFELTAGK